MKIRLETNVYLAQAYHCWLYIQIGRWAVFVHSQRARRGLRIVWRLRKGLLPRFRVARFKPPLAHKPIEAMKEADHAAE